jgi:hypothetical protein
MGEQYKVLPKTAEAQATGETRRKMPPLALQDAEINSKLQEIWDGEGIVYVNISESDDRL